MAEKFKDRSLAILQSGIDTVSTTLNLEVGHGTKFPDPLTDGEFYAQIFDTDYGTPAMDPNAEWVKVTAVTGDVLTIERAQKGDAAADHNVDGKTYMLMAGPSAEIINTMSDFMDSIVVLPNGNVGIGVSNPTNKFEVDGTVSATAFVGDGSGLTGVNASQWDDVTGGINYAAGNVGIGTTNPDEKFHISGGDFLLDNNHELKFKDASGNSRLMLKLDVNNDISIGNSAFRDFIFHVGSLSNAFIIKETSGNVGVGVINPSDKLEVNGTVSATSFVGDGSGLTGINQSQWDDVTGGINYAAGNVGIGTTTPNAMLEVRGNLSSTLTGTVSVGTSSNSVVGIGTAFTTELSVGDAIKIEGEVFTVETITDDTNLTLDSTHTTGASVVVAFHDTTLMRLETGDEKPILLVDKTGNVAVGTNLISSYKLNLPESGGISFGDDETAIYENSGKIIFRLSSNPKFQITSTGTGTIESHGNYGPKIVAAGVSLDNPGIIPNKGASLSGLGGSSTAQEISLITNGSARLFVGSTGDIGIGNTNPSSKLDVDGTVTATAFVGDGSGLTGISGGGAGHWDNVTGGINYASGNVGIGTTNPSATLDVAGDIKGQDIYTGDHFYIRSQSNAQLLFRPDVDEAGTKTFMFAGQYESTRLADVELMLFGSAAGFNSHSRIGQNSSGLYLRTGATGGNIEISTSSSNGSLTLKQSSAGTLVLNTTSLDINYANVTMTGNLDVAGELLVDSSNIYIGDRGISNAMFIGNFAGTNSSGQNVTVIGEQAAINNTGTGLTAVGRFAAYGNSVNDLTAIGYQAGNTNSGTGSVFVGTNAGYQNTGDYSVAIGYYAGEVNAAGHNIAIGYYAGKSDGGDYNTFLGRNSGLNNTGSHNFAAGYRAFYNTTETVSNTIYIGQNAGYSALGQASIGLGLNVLQNATNASDNCIGIGQSALSSCAAVGAIGIGYHANNGANIGSYGVAVGYEAGKGYTGANSVFMGYRAGRTSTGDNNIAIGNNAFYDAGAADTDNNITIGSSAGFELFDGSANNVLIGTGAGWHAGVTADLDNSIGIGLNALYKSVGSSIIAFGFNAGKDNTADDCVFIGEEAGNGNNTAGAFVLKQNSANTSALLQGNFSTGEVEVPGYISDGLCLSNISTSSPNSEMRKYINVGSYSGTGGAETGTMVIELPGYGHYMTKIRISGWSYSSSWEVIVDGYLNPNTDNWTSTSEILVMGDPPFNTDEVYLRADSVGEKFYIMLGTTSQNWGGYCHVNIDIESYYANRTELKDNWDISITATEPSYTNTASVDVMYFGRGSKVKEDVEITDSASGLVLSDGANRWRVTIDGSGVLQTTQL